MSVEPGFGGQALLPNSYGRIAEIRAMVGSRSITIGVDGGVVAENAARLADAGARR